MEVDGAAAGRAEARRPSLPSTVGLVCPCSIVLVAAEPNRGGGEVDG